MAYTTEDVESALARRDSYNKLAMAVFAWPFLTVFFLFVTMRSWIWGQNFINGFYFLMGASLIGVVLCIVSFINLYLRKNKGYIISATAFFINIFIFNLMILLFNVLKGVIVPGAGL